jgi:hypothetical protein
MRYFRLGPGLTARLFLFLAVAFLASGPALAQTCIGLVGGICVTKYVVVQPIDVCLTTGWDGKTVMSCAPYNSSDNNPNPTNFSATGTAIKPPTTIGFVDATTSVNVTRRIWLQAGIDVVFLPMAFYNNTTFQNITDLTCPTSTMTCSSPSFKNLTSGKVKPALPSVVSPNSTTINMFFINTLSGDATVASPVYGFASIGANGIAIASNTFFPSAGQPVHFDTLAHELGHNFGLDHTTFGAGSSSSCPLEGSAGFPGGCNVMDAGNYRVIPSGTGCFPATTTPEAVPGGVLYVLDDSAACSSLWSATKPATIAPPTILDDMVMLGNSTVQQGQALSSLFMNATPNIPASAGGGDVSFTVTYPKINKAGGRPNEFIAALVLTLPVGFQFAATSGPLLFTQTGGTPVVASVEELNGNNGGGNSNCVKPISGGPSIECLEINFVPGTFTANTFISFTSAIVNTTTNPPTTVTSTTLGQLAGMDLTYVFSDLLATTSAFLFRDNSGNLTANSQLPDDTVTSTIVNPANFPTLDPNQVFMGSNQTGCTPTSSSPSCPSAANGGVPTALTLRGGD